MATAFNPWEEEEIKIVKEQAKKVKISPKGKKRIRRVCINASVVSLQEKKEVIALARRGIGFETASRVIEKEKKVVL